MLNNKMTPQNGLFLDENGEVHSIITLIKGISTGAGTSKMIQLQKGETHIQWKYSDEEAWNDLIAIAELKGVKGDQGIQGIQGTQGIQGVAGAKGERGDRGETGATGAKGADGFGTEEQYNDIIRRLEALEATLAPA